MSRVRIATLGLALLALAGCTNGLDNPTIVKTPRVLAMVADPPEAAPGEDVHVRVLAYDPMHRELHYDFCLYFDRSSLLGTNAASGAGGLAAPLQPGPVCHQTGAGVIPLSGSGETGTLPGALTAGFVAAIQNDARIDASTRAFLERVISTAGVGVDVYVDVYVLDGSGQRVELLTSSKTVGITTRAERTRNPPPPEFALGSDTVLLGGADPARPWECLPSFFTLPPVVTASTRAHPVRVALRPYGDPSLWEETFPIFDFSGGLRTGHEGAYYSWYATSDDSGNTMRDETTQAPSWDAPPPTPELLADPLQNNEWTVPRTPGTYDLWLVVRDGHLGTSACHTTVDVVAATN
jgi:hypothetical protein